MGKCHLDPWIDAYNNQEQVPAASNTFDTFNVAINVAGRTRLNNNPLYVKATGDNGATWSNTSTVTC